MRAMALPGDKKSAVVMVINQQTLRDLIVHVGKNACFYKRI